MSTYEITIINQLGELARVTSFVEGLGARHCIQRGALVDVQVALDEVLKNIIDYAYADQAEHEIRLRFRVSDESLEAEIEDDGVPFDPLTRPTPDMHAPLRERRVGGLGMHFVRNLMTDVGYTRIGGRNRRVLTKRFKK